MIDLVDELKKAYHNGPWHGNNILSLLLEVNPQKVFLHPIPNAHSIAELSLHLTAWTEEVIDRLNGEIAKEPSIGDWPLPKEKSETEWHTILINFKNANEKLIVLINNFELINWYTAVKDKRTATAGNKGINNAQLINGLIQHHAYHARQIALLSKF